MNRLGLWYRQLPTLIALVLLAAPAAAQEPQATPQREHTVRRGDTLWDLAAQYLANPFLWPMIYEANRSVVEDPHWIYPGEVLVIPGMLQPQVLGEPVVARPADAVPAAVPVAPAPEPATVDLRRPLIPVAEYYSAPWLDPAPQRALVGRVTRVADPSMAEDRLPPLLHPHYRVHIGELRNAAAAAGDTLLMVRLGREVRGYGQIVEPLALIRVDTVRATVLTGTVLVQFEDARVGDPVMPLVPMPELPRGEVQPVTGGIEGSLVEFMLPQQLYGTGDRGFVSLGDDQLDIGDELTVFVPARRVDNERPEVLPATEVARARVVRLTDRTATVRLIQVMDRSLRKGLPVRLIGRGS